MPSYRNSKKKIQDFSDIDNRYDFVHFHRLSIAFSLADCLMGSRSLLQTALKRAEIYVFQVGLGTQN